MKSSARPREWSAVLDMLVCSVLDLDGTDDLLPSCITDDDVSDAALCFDTQLCVKLAKLPLLQSLVAVVVVVVIGGGVADNSGECCALALFVVVIMLPGLDSLPLLDLRSATLRLNTEAAFITSTMLWIALNAPSISSAVGSSSGVTLSSVVGNGSAPELVTHGSSCMLHVSFNNHPFLNKRNTTHAHLVDRHPFLG
jgi:hypothetical protein